MERTALGNNPGAKNKQTDINGFPTSSLELSPPLADSWHQATILREPPDDFSLASQECRTQDLGLRMLSALSEFWC